VYVTYFLVALGFLLTIFCHLRGVQAFLEEEKRLVEVVHVLELDCDHLVHSNQLLGNLLLNFLDVSVNDLLESKLHVVLCIENVKDLFLADTEALVGLCLADNVLGLNTGI